VGNDGFKLLTPTYTIPKNSVSLQSNRDFSKSKIQDTTPHPVQHTQHTQHSTKNKKKQEIPSNEKTTTTTSPRAEK
jgi:hypothetical protein